MTIGVCFSPEPGLVRMTHVRAVLGPGVKDLEAVELVVTAGMFASEVVELTTKPSGRGAHVVFRCPKCCEPRSVLHVDPGARLSCADCSGYMTRRHRESSKTEWKEFGLEFEDRLFRVTMKPTTRRGRPSLRRIRRLVDEIVHSDLDRLGDVLDIYCDAVVLTEAKRT